MILSQGNTFSRQSKCIDWIGYIILCIFLFNTPLLYSQTGPGGVGNNTDNKLWLRADAISGINDGNPLGTWLDFSGNNNDFTQLTPLNRPLFQLDAINGRPAVSFDGEYHFLEDPDGESYINGANQFSIFAVIKSDVTGTDAGFFDTEAPDNNDNMLAIRYDKANLAGTRNNLIKIHIRSTVGATGIESSENIQTTNTQLINADWLANNALRLFINGNPDILTYNGGNLGGNLSGATHLYLGRGPKDGHVPNTNGWDGLIAEFIYFDTRVNIAQRIIIENYLSSKYGFTIPNDYYEYDLNFGNDVAGVGRTSAANQHTSATSSNVLNISDPTGLNNGEYLLFGHNGGSLDDWTSAGSPSSEIDILERIWRLDETGVINFVDFRVDVTDLPEPPDASCDKYILLIDSDGDFSSGANIIDFTPLSLIDNVATNKGDYVTIGIRRAPTAEISPDPADVCEGNTLALNGNPSGGEAPYSHAWTGPGASVLSNTGIVDPQVQASALAGSYDITYTVTDNHGCTGSDNITVEISSPSVGGTVNVNNPVICEEDAAVFTLSGETGAITKWQKKLSTDTEWTDIPVSDNPLTEVITTSGTWDYRAVVKNGICDELNSSIASVVVNPLPSPAISGNDEVCPNSQDESYSTPDIIGNTYTWQVSGGNFDGPFTNNSVTIDWDAGPAGRLILTETITATGCDFSDTLDIIIEDTTDPAIACATPGVSYNADPDECFFTVPDNSLNPVSSSDNCSVASVLNNFNNTATLNGAQFPVGTTTVIWTVTDVNGNTSTCSYDMVVVDNQDPAIACATPGVSYNADPDECFFTVPDNSLNPVSSSDNCSVASVINNFNSTGTLNGAQFPVGTTTVIWTVTDVNGNTSTCSYDIVVLDNQNPAITCATPEVSYNADPDECFFTVPDNSLNPVSSSDNCSVA
ncbi:MAG: HYR domain-containing protein, partial [Bacteroidales bacterium]|nr:HYR domain-containing protein [Bacteroidales bacterium]